MRDFCTALLPLVGAAVEIYGLDAASGERVGTPLLMQTIGADGRWGLVTTDSHSALEFVISAPRYAITHIYRSPFVRSSDVVHLQARMFAKDKPPTDAVVIMSRPRGFFIIPRDKVIFDGLSPPPGIETGLLCVNNSVLRLNGTGVRAITAEFNGERVTGRTWPMRENDLVVLELHQ